MQSGLRASAREGGRELRRGNRAEHANCTHAEPRLKTFTYGGQLRAAFGKTGSASRCMMVTLYDREHWRFFWLLLHEVKGR